MCCGDGFGYGSSGAQVNDALNVARCMKNTDDLQWFCFVPIDHQVPEKWLFRSKDGVTIAAPLEYFNQAGTKHPSS